MPIRQILQGKMSAGNGQIAARTGSYHIVAAWFHVVHISKMPDCEKSRLTINADIWHPTHEIVYPTQWTHEGHLLPLFDLLALNNSAVKLFEKERWHAYAMDCGLRP